jgi:hypothetical protein
MSHSQAKRPKLLGNEAVITKDCNRPDLVSWSGDPSALSRMTKAIDVGSYYADLIGGGHGGAQLVRHTAMKK